MLMKNIYDKSIANFILNGEPECISSKIGNEFRIKCKT